MTRITTERNIIQLDGCSYMAKNNMSNIIKIYLKHKTRKIMSTLTEKKEKFFQLDTAREEITLADQKEKELAVAREALALMPRNKKLDLAAHRVSLNSPDVIASVVADLNRSSDRLGAKRKLLALALESDGESTEALLDKIIIEQELEA
jgi:hypothetical protein